MKEFERVGLVRWGSCDRNEDADQSSLLPERAKRAATEDKRERGDPSWRRSKLAARATVYCCLHSRPRQLDERQIVFQIPLMQSDILQTIIAAAEAADAVKDDLSPAEAILAVRAYAERLLARNHGATVQFSAWDEFIELVSMLPGPAMLDLAALFRLGRERYANLDEARRSVLRDGVTLTLAMMYQEKDIAGALRDGLKKSGRPDLLSASLPDHAEFKRGEIREHRVSELCKRPTRRGKTRKPESERIQVGARSKIRAQLRVEPTKSKGRISFGSR